MPKSRPLQESVTVGTAMIGIVISNDRGYEAYGPFGAYVATFDSKQRARRTLFDMHKASAGEDA